jgi:hypothetical protein
VPNRQRFDCAPACLEYSSSCESCFRCLAHTAIRNTVIENHRHPDDSRLYVQLRTSSKYYQAVTFLDGRTYQSSLKTTELPIAFDRALTWSQQLKAGELKHRNEHVQALFKNAKQRARRAGIPFQLRPHDLHIPDHCPVLDIPLFRAKGQGGVRDHSPTIDRIDNTRGYERGNIVVVSYRANRIKSDATLGN